MKKDYTDFFLTTNQDELTMFTVFDIITIEKLKQFGQEMLKNNNQVSDVLGELNSSNLDNVKKQNEVINENLKKLKVAYNYYMN